MTARQSEPAASLLDETLRNFLDHVSEKTAAPGGGAVGAVGAATAAALAAMAARFAGDGFPEGADFAARAESLRTGVATLADADAASYEEVLRALRVPKEPDGATREHEVRLALSTAADVPLSVAVAAAEIAELAAQLADSGNSSLKGDAAAGAILAEAAARIGAVLVTINLAGTDDGRIARAHELEEIAADAARRAVRAAVSLE